MTRSRRTARDAGTRFETLVAAYLADRWDDRIERRTRGGVKDRGDISGFRYQSQRVVVECKNTNRAALSAWWAEAELERGNDDAVAALVVHKRHGKGSAEDQWVTLTLGDLVALLTGSRAHLDES